MENLAQEISDNRATLEDLESKFKTYYTNNLNLRSIIFWLLQFPDLESVRHSIGLLKEINFVPEPKLIDLLLVAIQNISWFKDHSYICPFGSFEDSASQVSYGLFKKLFVDDNDQKARAISLSEITSWLASTPSKKLIFVDDNLTSGIQFVEFMESPAFQPLLTDKDLQIALCVALELSDGRQRIDVFAKSHGLNIQVSSGYQATSKFLEFGHSFWPNRQSCESYRQTLAAISREILADKNWPPEKLEDRLIGYGNLGNLTVFPHNVPKSLVTPLWKYGTYNKRPWIPLFPERDQFERMRKEKVEHDLANKFVVDQIINGQFSKAKPSYDVGVVVSDHTVAQDIIIYVQNHKVLEKRARNMAASFTKAERQNPPITRRPSNFEYLTSLTSMDINEYDYASFNSAVDSYNDRVERYPMELFEYFKESECYFSLQIRVTNTGSATASDVVLLLHLTDGLELISEAPKPPYPPGKKPELKSKLDQMRNRLIFREQDKLAATVMEAFEAGPDYQLERDNNANPQIKITYGKIMQSDFKDATVKLLKRPEQLRDIKIPFTIISDTAAPIKSELHISVTEANS